MATRHLLIIIGGIIAAVAILSVSILIATDPNRGKDFSRLERSDPMPTVYSDPYLNPPDDMVKHPLTGEWITKEEAEAQEKTIEALLCKMGDETYCDR